MKTPNMSCSKQMDRGWRYTGKKGEKCPSFLPTDLVTINVLLKVALSWACFSC